VTVTVAPGPVRWEYR